MDDIRRFSEDSIFVKIKEQYKRIECSEILYIEASGSYSIIRMKDTELTLTYHLSEIESFIPDTIFLRVHRSYIVNKQYIGCWLGNTLFIGKTNIPIGRTYKEKLLSSFNIIDDRKLIKNKQD